MIWVDREGHKPIVIGADGSRLKRVGRAARLELNHLLGGRFHLTLKVVELPNYRIWKEKPRVRHCSMTRSMRS